jgi:hypothetical protein
MRKFLWASALLLVSGSGLAEDLGVADAAPAQLGSSDYLIIMRAASAQRPCLAGLTPQPPADVARRLIALGVTPEMKARFLANIPSWSSIRPRLEGLEPGDPDDVQAMLQLFVQQMELPGTKLDGRKDAAMVMLVSHYSMLAAGMCQTTREFRELLPKLRSDSWEPAIRDFDLESVQAEIDKSYECVLGMLPGSPAPGQVREFVASRIDTDDLQQDAYQFAVNMKLGEDRNQAGLYLATSPKGESTSLEKTEFYLGFLLGQQERWKSFDARLRSAALGVFHMSESTKPCGLGNHTLSMLGKSRTDS